MNPTILKADVLGFPEFSALDQGQPNQLDLDLAMFNTMADGVVSDKVFPGIPTGQGNGASETDVVRITDQPNTGSFQIAQGTPPNQVLTPNINWNDDIFAAQGKLEAIFGAGNVATSGQLFPNGLTFQGQAQKANAAVGPLSLVNNSLAQTPASRQTVQTITVSILSADHQFSRGGFVLSFNGNNTPFLDSAIGSVSAVGIQAALGALPGVGGNVTVFEDLTNALQIKFYVIWTGPLAAALQPLIQVLGNTLADSAGNPCLTSVADATGSVQQFHYAGNPATQGAFQFSLNGQLSQPIGFANVLVQAAIEAALQACPAIGVGNAHVVVTGGPPNLHFINIFFQNGLANVNVPQLQLAVNTLNNGPSALALNVLANPPAGVTPLDATLTQVQRGFAPMTVIYMAKMLVICHWLKLTLNTEGRVSSDKVGDVASQYRGPSVDSNQDWNETIYGERYLVLRRIYAPGVSFSPVPGQFPTLPTVNPQTGP